LQRRDDAKKTGVRLIAAIHGRRLGLPAVVAFLLTAYAPPAWAQTVAGVWQQIDPSTGRVGALVTFAESNGIFSGAISKLFPDPGDDQNPLCLKCPDGKRNQPILGLEFIEGMRRSGLAYEGGTILDPDSGTLYNANMQLSPDGNELMVRGYVGIPLLGQSQIWRRVR
jgi:Uncharacterized protein conserved in bacteria (DUF2147)